MPGPPPPPFPPVPQITERSVVVSYPAIVSGTPRDDDWAIVSRVITPLGSPLLVQEKRSAFPLHSVATPTVDTLLAAQTEDVASPGGRRGLYIFNNAATQTLYLLLRFSGPPPPIFPSNFTTKVLPQQVYVMPFPMFVAQVWGVWDGVGPVVTDDVQITDLS